MDIKTAATRLSLIGFEVLRTNNFAVLYKDRSIDYKYGVILVDDKGKSRDTGIKYSKFEFGKHMVVLGKINSYGSAIFVKGKLDSIICEDKDRPIYTHHRLMLGGNERYINDTIGELVLVQPESLDDNEFELINYRGDIIKYKCKIQLYGRSPRMYFKINHIESAISDKGDSPKNYGVTVYYSGVGWHLAAREDGIAFDTYSHLEYVDNVQNDIIEDIEIIRSN